MTPALAVFIFSSQGWENFFLVCFGVGFVMSLISFVAGSLHLHLPTKWHVPQVGHHAATAHVGAHGLKIPTKVPVAHGHGASGTDGPQIDLTHVSAFNFPSIMAFFAWFGAVGYLSIHHYLLGWMLSLGVSLVGGIIGGGIVYMFLKKLMSYEGSMDPDDYRMVGTIGTLNFNLREGGTGELIYVQGEARKVCAARSDEGKALEKGAEVVVTRYEKGIAYVRRWEDWAQG
jgi:hypothetical protein